MVFSQYRNFYKKSIKKHGVSPLGVHWKNKTTQYERFKVLTSFIEDDIKSSSIVDAGCGFGEYYKYLKENDLLPREYIGLDSEKEMIKRAKKRFDTNFDVRNILKHPLPQVDYYVCSGALNILEYKEVKRFIERMYTHSNKGVVFNFLRGFTFKEVKKNHIMQILKYYSCTIKVREDYLENDFTIFMVK